MVCIAINNQHNAGNHLFSPFALIDSVGDVAERCEYNACVKATVYTDMTDWQSATPAGNPYLFTDRRLDTFADTANFEIILEKHRNLLFSS